MHEDPIQAFQALLKEAEESEPRDANAMALATVSADGTPSVRIVLLKGVDRHGFVFYTNFNSRKGRELVGQRKASLCFHWKSLGRQVRIEGPIADVSDDEADAYFASRALGSQVGAWASRQSETLASRTELEAAVKETETRFAGGVVPRPPHWGGFRLVPNRIEFWTEQPFRLHDRLLYERKNNIWENRRLFP